MHAFRWIAALKARFARCRNRPGRAWLVLFLIPSAIAATAVVTRVPEPLAEYILLEDMDRRATLWERRTLALLDAGLGAFTAKVISGDDRVQLRAMTQMSDVYRIKLLAADGTILWSTRRGEIGRKTEEPWFKQIVARGMPFARLATKSPAEIDGLKYHAVEQGGSGATRKVSEIYRPVMGPEGFVGAIEFYSDVTDIYQALVRRLRILMGGGAGVAYLLLATTIVVTIRSHRRRLREMEERAARDQEAMAQQIRLGREVQLLGELNEWLQSASSLDELFGMVSRFMTHLLPDAEGSIYVYSNSRDVLDGWAAWNGGKVHDHIRPSACWGLRRGRTYTFGAGEVDFPCGHVEAEDNRPYFCFPILAHGETVGLMHLRAQKGESVERFRGSQKLAQMCAEQISMAIANVKMRDQLREQSIRDPLTGLYNRRHMNDRLRALLQRASEQGRPLAVLSIDVDHFKRFNDNHGHDAGDVVLRSVAEILADAVDGDELACRPGGEEFAVILPDTAPEEAVRRAERLRRAVEELAVRYGEKTLPRITISVGVAAYPAHGTTAQDLLLAADEALYEAKHEGRNRVVLAHNAPERAGVISSPAAASAPAAPADAATPDEPAPAPRPDTPAEAGGSKPRVLSSNGATSAALAASVGKAKPDPAPTATSGSRNKRQG